LVAPMHWLKATNEIHEHIEGTPLTKLRKIKWRT